MAIYTVEGKRPQLAAGAWVHEQACVSGEVFLGEDSNVWPMAVVRGDVMPIKIGARTSVQDGVVLHGTHVSQDYAPEGFALTIGDEVIVGHRAVLHGCTIHNEVLIGMGAIVLDGALIESQVLLAAGALVTPNKRLLSGFLYAGSPARAVRELSEKEKAFFKYSAAHYVRLAQAAQRGLRID